MKNKLISSLMIFMGLIIISCDRQEFDDLPSSEYKYIGMVPQRIPNGNSVFEGTGSATSSIEIPMFYDLGNTQSDIDVTFSVTGSAELGTDFEVVDAKSVSGQNFTLTIPADTVATSFTIVPTTNDVQNENKIITLTISETPDGVFAGAPVSAVEDITILDDDCPYGFSTFVGTASIIENGSVGPYTANTTEVAPNTIEIDNFWDSGITATFVLVPCDGSVQVPQQSTPAFGDPDGNIVGSGTWNDETGVLVVDVTISFPMFNFVSIEQHVYTFP